MPSGASDAALPRRRESGVENAEDASTSSVTLDEEIVGRGVGRTKQAAEHAAAREALARIETRRPGRCLSVHRSGVVAILGRPNAGKSTL